MDLYQEKINSHNDNKKSVEYFSALMNKYSKITEITPQILVEFSDKILIHQSEKSKNDTIQVIEIYYKGVGVLN